MSRALITVLATVAAAIGAGAIVALVLRALVPSGTGPVSSAPPAATAETMPVSVPATPAALPDVLIDPRLTIDKSARVLSVFSAGEVVKSYTVALGSEPLGHKQREGDKRTPEGQYYICTKNDRSKFHRFLGLSYPNTEDANRALADHRISARDHRGIVSAIRRMERPPWKTVLGGEIGIHGGGVDGDWTLGCIAMTDEDAAELFSALPLGTPVEIAP